MDEAVFRTAIAYVTLLFSMPLLFPFTPRLLASLLGAALDLLFYMQ